MRRTFAFMLALVLILSLSVSAFAADPEPVNGTITVNNAINGIDYKLFKIFDATYKADAGDADNDGTKDVVSYTLSTSSPVYTYMFSSVTEAEGKRDNGVFTYDVATGVVTLNSGVDAIGYLTTMIRDLYNTNEVQNDGCFVDKKTAADQKVEFTGLSFGYYLIDKEDAAVDADDTEIAVTITTNTPSVNVIDKNKAPGDMKKNATSESVNVGDTITWNVTFLATNYDGNNKVTDYTVTDTLSSEWAELKVDSIVVKVGDRVLDEANDEYDLTVESATKFVIDIPWLNADGDFLYGALETVTITYSATVLPAAATATELTNSAELDWNHEGGVGDGDDVESETEFYNIGFTKIDGAITGGSAGLANAEFKLYNDPSCSDASQVCVEKIADGVYRVSQKDGEGNPFKNDIIVSPADGKVVIQGLVKGTYYLKETKAPNGYNKLSAPIEVKIGEKTTDTDGNEIPVESYITVNGTTYTVAHGELPVVNNRGVELPSTGGVGTMMMITFGTMVAIAFAVLMITQKKMSIYRD